MLSVRTNTGTSIQPERNRKLLIMCCNNGSFTYYGGARGLKIVQKVLMLYVNDPLALSNKDN